MQTHYYFSEQNWCTKIKPTVEKPVLINVQDIHPDKAVFSFGIAERCTKHEKILKFLASGSIELERGGLDLALLSDLMDIRVLTSDVHQLPCNSLVYPSGQSDARKVVDFVGDLVHSSKFTVHPDGPVLFTGTGTEMKDILSVVAEFYLSKNSIASMRQSVLVPHFSWPDISEAQASVIISSLKVKDVAAAPLKRCEKNKLKPATKKKTSKRNGRERDPFHRSYFRACESLLSLMIDEQQHPKTAFSTLKKSGPQLPALLTQFSAGIAVLFFVLCQVACAGAPLCLLNLLSTGLGGK